jgi:hypothetical protein
MKRIVPLLLVAALPRVASAQGIPVAGDTCSDPIAIAGEGVFAWDNTGATTSLFDGGGNGLCWGPLTQVIEHDVFLVWTAPCGGSFSFLVSSAAIVNPKRSLHLLGDCNAVCVQGIDDTFFQPYMFVANVAQGDQLLLQVGSTTAGDVGAGTVEVANTAGPCPICACTPGCPQTTPHHEGGFVTLHGNLNPGTGAGIHLNPTGGPDGEFGFLLVSAGGSQALPVFQGTLCLDGPQGRYNGIVATNQGLPQLDSLGQFDASGAFVNLAGTSTQFFGYDVPLELPFAPAGQTIAPGDTYSFQLWYRDETPTGAPSANFSNLLEVPFP